VIIAEIPFQISILHLHVLSILPLNKSKINMQAYGRYDFVATANDELSFPKGAVLKVQFVLLFAFSLFGVNHASRIGSEHRRRYELVQSRIERTGGLRAKNVY
jgi:hypothetical protein